MVETGRFKTLQQFLSLFPKVVKTGDGFNCRCPAHPDSKPSLHVSEHEDKILLHCHAGCNTDAILSALKIDPRDLFLSRNGQNNPLPSRERESKIVKTYDYLDADSKLLFQTVRYDPKDFRQRRPDGHGDWIWDLKGVEPVLYHLPELITAIAAGHTIYIVEGEKDADSLCALGLVATTSPMGAGKWKRLYSESLQGANVIIIPDSDPPGIAHGEAVRTALTSVANSLRLLRIPTGLGKDITEFFDSGADMVDLVDIPPLSPPSRPDGILLPLCADGESPASDPVVSIEIDGLSLTWGPEHIRCEVTRLYQHHNGDVACEVFFTYALPGEESKYILRDHINDLGKSSIREGMAKRLNKFSGPNWPAILHQVSEYTLSQLRRLPEGVTTFEFEDFKAPEYLLHPFLIRHENNLLFSPGGGGKSYLAELWIALMESQTGHKLPWIVRPEYVRGLMLDWERSYDTNAYRFGQILLGLNLPPSCPDAPFSYQRLAQPLIQEIRNVQYLINKFRVNFLLCDSALGACGGDLFSPSAAGEYFRGLNTLHAFDGGPLTTLTLAHTAKNTETGRKSAYGAAMWTNEPSSVWELVPSEDKNHNVTRFTLQDNKHNHGWQAPQSVQVDYKGSPDGTIYSSCEPLEITNPHKHWSVIYDALAASSSIKTLAEITKLSYATVQQNLLAMEKAGHAKKLDYGAWSQGLLIL